jgi:hypothetical protein
MEHAQTAVPQGPGLRVRGERPVRFSLLFMLVAGWPLLAAEPSHPYLLDGPPALRFGRMIDPTRKFNWPSLFPEPSAVAKSNAVEHASMMTSATNSASTVVTTSTAPPTSPPLTQTDIIASTEPYPPQGVPSAGNLDNTSSSASPMLLVTPQMLADFFRSNVPAANVVPNWDLRFMPPVAMPLPSSEAVYRSD